MPSTKNSTRPQREQTLNVEALSLDEQLAKLADHASVRAFVQALRSNEVELLLAARA